MLRIRRFEESCQRLSTGEGGVVLGSVHLCLGQEAIPVGTMDALGPGDRVIATYRGHGWALESGVSARSLLAEVCHRPDGINGGRGGSALVMGVGSRMVLETSIVGAGGPIGAGIALAAKHAGQNRVVAVSFGDGAMSQGALNEAFVFASRFDLPVLFICEDNGWAEMTPNTGSEDPATSIVARARSFGLFADEVDGCDVEAVRQAVTRAAEQCRTDGRPAFLHCRAVRLSGHYNRDIEHYRPADDKRNAAEAEPIARLRRRLIDHLQVEADRLDEIEDEVACEIDGIVDRTLATTTVDGLAHTHVSSEPARRSGRLEAVREAADGKSISYIRAVNEALRSAMSSDEDVIVLGEDVGFAGGIFGATKGLQKEFGESRVLDAPIAEAAILGAAVGASMSGLRPVAEIMWADFVFVALDQIVNQAANIRYISQGAYEAPMVVRMQQGATPGSCAQHGQSIEALLAHIPGLKVGLPSNAQDAYDMLRAAIADSDPCVIIEARSLYPRKGIVDLERQIQPAASASLVRAGSDVAIISWGTMVPVAEAAAAELAEEGISASVLDLRWLTPLDRDAIRQVATDAGGRVVVVHEANLQGGFGAEVLSVLTEDGFYGLAAPPVRIGAPNVRMPAAPSLQRLVIPNQEQIVDRCRDIVRSTAPVLSSELG